MPLPIIPVAIAAIAAGIKGATAIAKGIKGRRDKRQGESEMNTALDNIKYTRPEEYGEIMNILNQRKSSIPSRREAAEDRVENVTASSQTGIGQLADSPVAALGAYGGLKQREQQAIADIGLEYEGKRDEAILGQAEGLKMGVELSEKENYYNDMYKNMVRANMGASKMSGGNNQMWQGIEEFGGAAIDFLGTRVDSSTDPTTDASLANF